MFDKLLQWLKIPVAEVSEEMAVCEFDCDKTECLLGDWRQCERRLKAHTPQQGQRGKQAG